MRTDLSIMRGDDRTYSVTVTDAAGLAYNLTGASVTFSVPDLGIEKTVGAGITVTTPASGIFTIDLVPDDTDGAADHRAAYPYDVQITLSDGKIKTPIRGLFVVLPDSTT